MNGVKGPAPRLNDPLYLAVVDKDSLYNTIKYGRPGTPMPALGQEQGGPLTDRQIGILVDGIRTHWAKPVDLKGATPPAYSVDKAPPGDAARGQVAYQRNCMMCHGFGKFKGTAGPVAEPHYVALASNQSLRTTMIVGRPDWGMPDWQHRIPGHPMTDQEISDVTAWLASLRPRYAQQAVKGGPAEPHPPAPRITTSIGQSDSKQGK
jgi:mono/diheme cytochrome c family protein